jgi:hypothetical protein
MLAVAAVGVALGTSLEGSRLVWLARHYRQTGEAYGRHAREAWTQAHEALVFAEALERSAAVQAASPDLQESAANAKKLAVFHRELARRNGRRAAQNNALSLKYLQAASRPWVPVSPDLAPAYRPMP